jgi:predicted 3-demethylubiquinone-9 3-methyltransferase (glyoxalase superfamily)
MMATMTPFLWLQDNNAEQAAEFYLGLFPEARKVSELRSSGPGPWEKGALALVTVEMMGQQVTLFNGGSPQKLTDAFSFSLACRDQAEIDKYWAALSDGGTEIQCGWVRDRFGVAWQVVPENIGELLKHPKAMEAMMKMVKMDVGVLEAAAKE